MLQASTIQLLRFKFSFFLMPIFWFALSQVNNINISHTILIFIILHLLIYPASNGYNSYMDKDESSIGGIKKPLRPTKQLFYITALMDIVALLLSLFINLNTTICILGFIAASRAYSYRGIRLKKYPFVSFFITSIFQGGLVFYLTYYSCNNLKVLTVPWLPIVASSLLVGSFYPLTQIYQHKQDAEDGVNTLSMVLGYKGTFIFSGITFFAALCTIGLYFIQLQKQINFIVFLFTTIPVLCYFMWWFIKVIKNNTSANFVNTMHMNIIASICTNASFLTVLLIEKF